MEKRELPLLHQQVLGLIPKGGERSITFREIMQILGLSKQYERDIRQVLVDLVMKYGYPIGSVSGGSMRKGFFLIETVAELEAASYTLTSRKRHIERRNTTMIENFRKHNKLSINEAAKVKRLIN